MNNNNENTEVEQIMHSEHQKPFDKEIIDDEHVCALVDYLNMEQLDSVIENRAIQPRSEDASNILQLIEDITVNSELANKIDTITSHMVTDRETVINAGDRVEEILGMRPFELSVTNPDNEFQDPMVSIHVNDVHITKNEKLNSRLINYACRIHAETGQGQYRLFEKWCNAINEDVVRGFKQSRNDPEALNFVIPDMIPATGDKDETTAITEIPYIGPSTAEEIHPNGDVMSIEDYVGLTPKQHSVITLPLADVDYYTENNESFKEMLDGFIEIVPDEANLPDALGYAMEWIDKSGEDKTDMKWLDEKRIVGITESTEILLMDEDEKVTLPNDECEKVKNVKERMMKTGQREKEKVIKLTGENGGHAILNSNLWDVISRIKNHVDSELHIDPKDKFPVCMKFDTDEVLIIAQRNK